MVCLTFLPLIIIIFCLPIVFHCGTVLGQAQLKGKPKEIAPIESFAFLVEAENLIVASTIRYEQMDILIGIDFDDIKYKEIAAELDIVMETFPKFNFFKDAILMEEYAGLCLIGQNRFNKFHKHMKEIFKFKNEKVIDEPVNICSLIPLEMNLKELSRDKQNLQNRLRAINANWDAATIKTSVEAQNILFEFCSYMNDFATIYEIIADDMLTSLEMLSDKVYPEVLFGELTRDCNGSRNGEGEKFDVTMCKKTNKGYRCQITITQSINLKEYTKVYPIHYDNIRLSGFNDNDNFAKTLITMELRYMSCDNSNSGDYPVCIEQIIPEPCNGLIIRSDIKGIINNCNFTRSIPQIGIMIPYGGIIIQGNGLEIKNGENSISHKTPMVIYSPETITITDNKEDYVYPPAITIEELTIVESKLSLEEIEYLKNSMKWEEVWENTDYEDLIDYILIILQIIIFPLAIASCYYANKHRKFLGSVEKQRRKGKGKENYKQNQYLLRKI
jgi:hypothetical protein